MAPKATHLFGVLAFFSLFFLSLASHSSSSSKFPRRFSTPLQSQQWTQPLRSNSDGLYETRYFTQTLDHFNFQPHSYTTFQQRYLVNGTYWGGAENRASIFVYTGNEGGIEWFAQNTGFMFEVAPYFKALLIFIEHRYYGESIPFGGKDVAYRNATTLGYLSSTQALADYASLIIDLKKNLSAEASPVVVFGGSYGGMLAAWFRLKYPHVAIGAIASSSPILHFDDMVSPNTFNNIVTNDFRSASENCYKVIKGSWKEIEGTESQTGGFEKLEKIFKTCKGQIANVGVQNWIQYALVYAAMTDYPTASNFLTPLPAYPVKKMCQAIDNPTTGNDTFAKLYGAMNVYYNYSGSATCFALDSSDSHGMEEWTWQSCTKMILPTQGNSDESLFPAYTYNYTDDVLYCQNMYGVPPRPHWITTEFGGHDIKRVLKRFGSNIIFFNGLRDPWSGGGVLESLSKSLIAIVAPQGSHHVDLRFSTKEDPVWLKNVRRKEIRIIKRWLEEFYIDSKAA